MQLVDHHGGLVHQPDFARLLAGFLAAEERNGSIHRLLLLTKIENIAVRLGAVEHAVGARKRLDQTMVLQVLVHIQRVQELGIKTGQQHVHHNGDIDFLRCRQVGIRPLLVLDAFLHILVVQVKLAQAVVGAVARVVIGQNRLERGLLAFRVFLVVGLLLRQVFLDLLHIRVTLRRRRKHAGDVQRLELRIGGLAFGLQFLEQRVVGNGVVDGRGSQNGVETPPASGSIVLGQNRLDDGLFGHRFARLGWVLAFGLVVVHVEAQHVAILDGMGNGVGMQLLLEQVCRGAHGGLGILDFLLAGIGLENGCASKTEQLRPGEKRLDGLVVVAKLRAMAFVKNEDDALILQRFQLFLVRGLTTPAALPVALAVFVQRQAQFLDRGHDHLVGVVV